MSKIVKFKPKPPEDIKYMIADDGGILGINGKNIDMEIIPDDIGFLFNRLYVKREEIIAFVLISGLWLDVQDPEYCKSLELNK